jgi:hypothetical protein
MKVLTFIGKEVLTKIRPKLLNFRCQGANKNWPINFRRPGADEN